MLSTMTHPLTVELTGEEIRLLMQVLQTAPTGNTDALLWRLNELYFQETVLS